MNSTLFIGRMSPATAMTNPVQGRVVWSPVKSLWFSGHALIAVVGGWLTVGLAPVALAFGFTLLTLCLGHTVALHRLLVHLGTVVGMGGPLRILYMHDIRDWAQRHSACHPFFTDQSPMWKDFLWQMHGEVRLEHPPRFQVEPAVLADRVHGFMQATWMLQQLPWAVLFWMIAGAGGVVWGISVRIVVSLTGHWFIGWLAHNVGERDWHLEGHAVQGFNLPHVGMITMGEGWHNNHHAFPESARLGLRGGQHDPGWLMIRALRACGLAWDVKEPGDLPPRPERVRLDDPEKVKPRASAYFDLHLL